MGRRTDGSLKKAGGVAREGIPECLPGNRRQGISSDSQLQSARLEDMRLRRGKSPHDGRGFRKGITAIERLRFDDACYSGLDFQGLLSLEGGLPPILTLMVSSASKQDWMLNDDTESLKTRTKVKKTLHEILKQNKNLEPEDLQKLNPCGQKPIAVAIEKVKNPWQFCQKIYESMEKLKESIFPSQTGRRYILHFLGNLFKSNILR